MYIRYQIKNGATDNATSVRDITYDLRDILNGTITTPSGCNSNVCDIATTNIIGSTPSDYLNSITAGTNTSNSSDNFLQFYKSHYAWDPATYTFTNRPRARIKFLWSQGGTYGIRGRTGNYNGANQFPVNSDIYYTISTSSNHKISGTLLYEPCIHIWLTPQWFCLQIVRPESTSNNSEHTFGLFDYPTNDYVTSSFASNSLYYPGIHWSTATRNSYDSGDPSNPQCGIVFGHSDYIAADGSNQTITEQSATSYNDGYSSTTNSKYMSPFPKPWINQWVSPTTTGAAHQKVPVYCEAGMNNQFSFPMSTRLLGLHRTTDDFASTGTLVTVDGQQYAVMMSHKAGGPLYNSTVAIENACYLIPTTLNGS